jgi:hypothetical protein
MKKFNIISLVVSFTALIVSIVLFVIVIVKTNNTNNTEKEDIQYVLYLGTNDKDTNLPVFTKDKAKEELQKILINHLGGYTISKANGGWVDGETLYQEYILVIYLSDTTLEDIHLACNDMITVFNQSSVLIQSNKTTTEFYSGN